METHPLDIPTVALAHKEGDLVEKVEPYLSMFTS